MVNITKKFDWETKWLKGEEYYYILKNIDQYSQVYAMQKYPNKTHPLDIYLSPVNGLIYFMQGQNIEVEFGFPRVDIKKLYKWKKMNFSTKLPKKKPLVKYVVASATKFQEKGKPTFRMHAVVLNDSSENSFILCHLRQLSLDNIQTDPTVLKKIKREPLSPITKGLNFLLDAANKFISPAKSLDKENDYIQIFKDSKVDKFPALSSHFKPLFTLYKQQSN
jgi:hypothetical protein